jgi:HAD superfamily hydrolase (TIGR01490 family)
MQPADAPTLAGVTGHPREAAFFDLDKTIIAKSSVLVFGKQFFAGGLINRRAVLKATYAQLVYMAGADEDQIERIRRHLTEMIAGWDVSQVRSIVAETLHDVVTPIVYDEATELIADHRAEGRDVVIVSASGAEMVEPIGEMLGADHVIATTVVVEDEKYTGDIEFYAYGENKALAITRLAEQRGYDLGRCHAYSDSVSDLPMLEAVGHPAVVNPDRALRAIALERGWPILRFTRGVSLKERLDRLGKPSHPAIAGGAAVGAAAAVAGIALLEMRRRKKRRSSRTV